MKRYDEKLLNAMLDSYENSLLSKGENKVRIRIAFNFTKKNLPEYFDESSTLYETIHSAAKHLEALGLIDIAWKDGKNDHIINKLYLRDDNINAAYDYLKRTPEKNKIEQSISLLKSCKERACGGATGKLIDYLIERLSCNKSVKEYIDIANLEKTKLLIDMIRAVEGNRQDLYIREFSGYCFNDTKLLEKNEGIVCKVLRRFGDIPGSEEMDNKALLAEYNIYGTPNYVYVKGEAVIKLGDTVIDLSTLGQGIGISGEDIGKLSFIKAKDSVCRRIITVENLTAFFSLREKESVTVYLGGYPNRAGIGLLRNIYACMPEAAYLHFGDIDVGGFEILENLKKRSGISFEPFRMGCKELRDNVKFAKRLTAGDRARLDVMIARETASTDSSYLDVLLLMKELDMKLEQECIRLDYTVPI